MLLRLSESETVCILDSCGVRHLGSHLLIAGIRPIEVIEVSNDDPDTALELLDRKLGENLAGIFTLSYDFGRKLQNIPRREKVTSTTEPDLFLALFDALLVHDYNLGTTRIAGNSGRFDEIYSSLTRHSADSFESKPSVPVKTTTARSNLSRSEYMSAVEVIQEYIRSGDTYQTNLTQLIECDIPVELSAQKIFWRLRRDHPAPFAAFLKRNSSIVVSASPERFFRVDKDGRTIEASPIKGTRRRGKGAVEDDRLRTELLSSEKDRAENTMIVDLVRNDLGRVCEYGSVEVKKLCDLEEHPTLFHLVSTVTGKLRAGAKLSEILRAVFPCGSITGAPKIRTMQIIEDLEPDYRGLSMGAIGINIPPSWDSDHLIDVRTDLSVAIRTMTIVDQRITFNVGGGIVIDSDPAKEYDESLLKAAALMTSVGGTL